MPRLNLLRIVLLPVLVLVLVWTVLPFPPSVHGLNGSHYHQDVLRAGKRLTTTYQNHYLYDSHMNAGSIERTRFAIDWQLLADVEEDSITLRMGGSSYINLTWLANITGLYTDLEPSGMVPVAARAGDVSVGAMMPWFDDSDSCLLDWEVNRHTKWIDVRAIVLELNVIQIWPESGHWYKEPLTMPDRHSVLKPFLTISNIPVTGNKTDITQVEVDGMTWSVPTRTFPIRRLILVTIKDCAQILVDVFGNPVLFLTILVLCSYLAARRLGLTVSVKELLSSKWTYKSSKKRIIWGPGGLIKQADDEGGLDHEVETQPAELRTLRSPVDFFRSRSPLDDLLNTFTLTRWMTKPLISSEVHVNTRVGTRSRNDIAIRVAEEGKIKYGY